MKKRGLAGYNNVRLSSGGLEHTAQEIFRSRHFYKSSLKITLISICVLKKKIPVASSVDTEPNNAITIVIINFNSPSNFVRLIIFLNNAPSHRAAFFILKDWKSSFFIIRGINQQVDWIHVNLYRFINIQIS